MSTPVEAAAEREKKQATAFGTMLAQLFVGTEIDKWHEISKGDSEDAVGFEETLIEVDVFCKNNPHRVVDLLRSVLHTTLVQSMIAAYCIVDEETCTECPQCGGRCQDIEYEKSKEKSAPSKYVQDPGCPSKRCKGCGYTWGSMYRELEKAIPKADKDE